MKKIKEKITLKNGDKYFGELRDKKRNGLGIYIWKDGSKYDGEWKNDKKHGYGHLKDKRGENLYAIWQNGKFKNFTDKKLTEKIDIKYLRKKFNLKKFISLLNKNKKDYREIFDNYLAACSDKEIDRNRLFDELNGTPLYLKFEDSFLTGRFLPMISDNFILIKTYYIAEPKTDENKYIYDEKHLSFDHQILKSKVDGCIYVLIYHGYDYTNDFYYFRKKFKLQKDAEQFIKKEHKLLKKNIYHYSK